MHTPSKLAVALLAGALLSLPAVAAEKAPAKAGAVTVNGVAIPQSTFDAFYAEQKNQGMPDSAELRNAVREELIRRELLLQEAKKSGLDKNPAIASQMEMARQAVLIRALIQDYVKKNPVSDAQLKAEYDMIKTKMGGTEYKSRHILVETEEQAKTIIDNLKKGAKFEELAKQSKDPGSKDNGGELGWSAAGSYVPPFADALTKLAKGKYTEVPVKTDFGWHVIQMDDTRPLEAPAFEAIKPQLAQRANQQVVEKMIEGLRAKAKVQ
ncbi:MAG: peptidyl-prolyl cis-trans isomerase [Pseudomonadota bacterium]|nr:peptidyl-prolyl cis-trans isomerase [Pseudomonadota bacterium]MDQ5907869.1 peptidyl-prolyl cis-trans isomerase [Pseudomonadota bacterium]MDQ5917986.1 peptidyl-prolyl cis-trans isomerase [Pseudomonadota bacterium]MDQ5946806.1 peptidyl-prolyl cis-trans isomerase [Pseudomonadota bacterium]